MQDSCVNAMINNAVCVFYMYRGHAPSDPQIGTCLISPGHCEEPAIDSLILIPWRGGYTVFIWH